MIVLPTSGSKVNLKEQRNLFFRDTLLRWPCEEEVDDSEHLYNREARHIFCTK